MEKFDTLFFNGNIYTLRIENEKFSAMGIKRGKIVQLYKSVPDNYKRLSDNLIDLKQKSVVPGLIDSHCHFVPSAAYASISCPVSTYNNGNFSPNTMAEVQEKAVVYAEEKKDLPVLLFTNFIISSIKENRMPTRFEIDSWIPGKHVIFIAIDGHRGSYSTKTLNELEIDINSDHDGVLVGNDHKEAVRKIGPLMEKHLGFNLLINGIQKIINDYISFGVVGVHCLEGFEPLKSDKTYSLFKSMAKVIPMNIRIYPQTHDIKFALREFKNMQSGRIGGCGKYEIDGSVGAQTAAFYEPYNNNSNNRGTLYYTDMELNNLLKNIYNASGQTLFHAIGTRAIDQIINSYQKVFNTNNDSNNKLRWRIEHFCFPSKKALDFIVDHNIIISTQPGFDWMDENYPGMQTYIKYLPETELKNRIPLKTIMDSGVILCASTDSPVQSTNPFVQIHGMVNYPLESESLSVYQAFRAYTYNCAYATFEENKRGTLENGKYADFIILDSDPFTINKKDLINLKVISTYINGKKIGKIKLKNLISIMLKGFFSGKKL